MQGADAGCTHLYGEPEASAQPELISPPYPALTRRISEHTEDENKGAVTYVHLSHSAALDARSGYPQRKWLVCKRLSNSPPTTDNPPGQNLEWSRAGQLDWASFFLFLFFFLHSIHKNVSWADSSGLLFFVGFFFLNPIHRSSSSEGSFMRLRFPCQVSAFGSAGKLHGFFAVCRRKAACVCGPAALTARSLADLKRFPPPCLSLSIQSGAVCVYVLRQSRFKAPYTSPTESRLLRHKAQPPHPPLCSPPPPLSDLGC